MRQTTSNYDTENAKLNKSPCVIIEFNGVATKFCSNTFSGITGSYKKLIKNIDYSSRKWQPFEVFLDRAILRFTLSEDSSNTVLGLINANILINNTVTVKMGFDNIVESDFWSLETFTVKKISVSSNYLDHTFTCEEYDEFNNIFIKDIYTDIPTTFTTAAISGVATTINVESTTGFLDPASLPDGVEYAYIEINGEICRYGGVTATSFTTVTRGYNTTDGVQHSEGSQVKQCLVFGSFASFGSYNANDTIGQVALRTLTGTDAGTNGIYDTGINGLGLGLDHSEFDIDQIERECYRFNTTVESSATVANDYHERLNTYIFEPIKSSKFIEKLLAPYHGVMFVGSNGKIQIKILDLISMVRENLDETLTDSNSKVSSISWMDETLLIEARHKYDIIPQSNEYANDTVYTNSTAQTAYNQNRERELTNDYLRENWGGASYTSDIYHSLYRLMMFYGNMRCKLKIKSLMKNFVYEALDVIKLTSSLIPNWKNGNRTSTDEKIMITGQNIKLSRKSFSSDYEAIAFDLVDKVSSPYTLHIYTPGVSALTYNADFTATINAEDAYNTFPSPIPIYGNSYCKLQLVLPNGSDTEQWIDIGVILINNSSTEIVRNATRIRYNSSANETITIWIPSLSVPNASSILKYQKVDWFGRSTSTGADLPTITFQELVIYEINDTIS